MKIYYKYTIYQIIFKRKAYAKHMPISAILFNNKILLKINKNAIDKENDNKGFNKQSKGENQLDELWDIIQFIRAKNGKFNYFIILKENYFLYFIVLRK